MSRYFLAVSSFVPMARAKSVAFHIWPWKCAAIIEKRLFPFSFREHLSYHGLDFSDPQKAALHKNRILKLFETLLFEGGMPETFTVTDREVKREIIASYFDTIIFKDIVSRYSIRQSGLLKDLAVYLTNQVTSHLNVQKLAKLFSSNRYSIKEFLSCLDSSLFIFLMEKFNYSAKKRELSFKKVYLIDNAFYVICS